MKRSECVTERGLFTLKINLPQKQTRLNTSLDAKLMDEKKYIHHHD
jgi:hypothetical protein